MEQKIDLLSIYGYKLGFPFRSSTKSNDKVFCLKRVQLISENISDVNLVSCILSSICIQCDFDEWILLFFFALVVIFKQISANSLHFETYVTIKNGISNWKEKYTDLKISLFHSWFSVKKKRKHRIVSNQLLYVCGAIDSKKAAAAAAAVAINLLAPAYTINIEMCYCPAAAAAEPEWKRKNNTKQPTSNADWIFWFVIWKISVFYSIII